MHSTIKKFIPGIAWFFLVNILLFLPGNDLPSAYGWMETVYFDKWVHAGLFGILFLLFIFPLRKSPMQIKQKHTFIIWVFAGCIFWGLCTEIIQYYFTKGRSFDMTDWLADIAGISTAYFIQKKFLKKPVENKIY